MSSILGFIDRHAFLLLCAVASAALAANYFHYIATHPRPPWELVSPSDAGTE